MQLFTGDFPPGMVEDTTWQPVGKTQQGSRQQLLRYFFLLIKVSIIIRPLGLAERAQEEPLSNKGREDNAGDHHQDDPHSGNQPMQEDESGF